MRLAFPINAHQNANQKPIGSAPSYRTHCTLPPRPMCQNLLFDFSRVWFRDYSGSGWYGLACTFITSSDSKILCSSGNIPLLAFILLRRHMMQRFDEASWTKQGFWTTFETKAGLASVSNPRMLLCVSVLMKPSYCISCWGLEMIILRLAPPCFSTGSSSISSFVTRRWGRCAENGRLLVKLTP